MSSFYYVNFGRISTDIDRPLEFSRALYTPVFYLWCRQYLVASRSLLVRQVCHGWSNHSRFCLQSNSQQVSAFLDVCLFCSRSSYGHTISTLQGKFSLMCSNLTIGKWLKNNSLWIAKYVRRCNKIPGPPAQIPLLLGSATEFFLPPEGMKSQAQWFIVLKS